MTSPTTPLPAAGEVAIFGPAFGTTDWYERKWQADSIKLWANSVFPTIIQNFPDTTAYVKYINYSAVPPGTIFIWERNYVFVDADYQFSYTTADGMRWYIDDELITDAGWNHQTPTTYFFTKRLTPGAHKIRIDYYNQFSQPGVASVNLAEIFGPPTATLPPTDITGSSVPTITHMPISSSPFIIAATKTSELFDIAPPLGNTWTYEVGRAPQIAPEGHIFRSNAINCKLAVTATIPQYAILYFPNPFNNLPNIVSGTFKFDAPPNYSFLFTVSFNEEKTKELSKLSSRQFADQLKFDIKPTNVTGTIFMVKNPPPLGTVLPTSSLLQAFQSRSIGGAPPIMIPTSSISWVAPTGSIQIFPTGGGITGVSGSGSFQLPPNWFRWS